MRCQWMGVLLLSSVSGILFSQAAAPAAKPANLIVNGGFEKGKNPGAYATLPVRSRNIPGWFVTAGTVDYIGTYFKPHGGKRCIDLDGTPGPGTIQQNFFTTPGRKYRVTFAMEGNREGAPTVKTLRVSAAGDSADFLFDTAKHKTWVVQTWEFTAKDNRTALTFRSLSAEGNLYGALLDDVKVFEEAQ